MDKKLIRQFNIRMIDLYQQTKRETGYNPTRFLQMINASTGYEAAKALIRSHHVAEGCTKLWELKRLDLSVEAEILKEKWDSLFTNQEKQIARKRLVQFGYYFMELL